MTTSRIPPARTGTLLALLSVGLSLIFLLPKGSGTQPLGVVEMSAVPEYVTPWRGKDVEVTEKERQTLGYDTGFSRKLYTTLGSLKTSLGHLPPELTAVSLTIVLSGQEMNTSIHRPERCLPTQGWNIVDSSGGAVHLPERGSFPYRRLLTTKLAKMADGTIRPLRMIHNYWFIGHTGITNSHAERTFIDMKDRLLQGYNQRWAYVTVAASVPIQKEAPAQAAADQAVDEMLRLFMEGFAPKVLAESVELR